MTENNENREHKGVDVKQFSMEKDNTLAQMYEDTLKDFTEGTLVKGKVLEIMDDEVLVDIGFKSEGLINTDEFSEPEEIKAGDEIDVWLEEIEDEDGNLILSRQKAERQKMWDDVLSSKKEGSTIPGEIKRRVRGGFIVDIKGVKAFLPGSQLDVSPVRNLDDFLNQTFDFKLMKIDHERNNIVVSRRELLEEQQREQRKQLLSEIKVNDVRSGVVKNITSFGAFINLGGMDGLLHITDMSWGRINHPSKMLEIGQTVEVVILDIDYEKERVSLGLKQKTKNPWDDIEEKYPIGSLIHGKVVNLLPYGVFIEVEKGIEGLVHVSEMSWVERITSAHDKLELGQEVDVVVLNINVEEQKLSLSIKRAAPNPWEKIHEKFPVGSRVTGTVRNFTTYGAFIELEKGIDGMIHVSDMSWTRKINHPSEVLKKGQEIEVVVLEVDTENQRISLGFKQAQEDPWTTVTSKFKMGQIIEGKVLKMANFGAFIEIEKDIEGLVHISQISEEKINKPQDVLKEGQTVKARIIKIDPVEQRIGLSIKAADIPDEEFEVKDDMLAGLKPGEELVDLAGAFDEAYGSQESSEEWRPGEAKDKEQENSSEQNNQEK
jgi:small subunit ribosomal protein S1